MATKRKRRPSASRTSRKKKTSRMSAVARNRKRTSRGLRRNATCPSCGSPHYFEGLMHRDCATPSCRYFRGGKIVEAAAAIEPLSVDRGFRRLGMSSETITPIDGEEYPDVQSDMDPDIDLYEEDLEEGETFAAAAARIIADELGHVEGSESSGPVRWYTQTDGSDDYHTGSTTRRSIFVDNETWSAEERKEIYDILKRRKLTSNTGRRPRHLRRNAIPAPTGAYPQMLAWAQRTYAPGTPVKFQGGGVPWWPGARSSSFDRGRVLVPDETRGTVVAVVGNDHDRAVWVQVNVVDARSYAYAAAAPPGEKSSWMEEDIRDLWKVLDEQQTTVVSYILGLNALQVLVPMVDNWAAVQAPRGASRYSLPSSQKRRFRPNPDSRNSLEGHEVDLLASRMFPYGTVVRTRKDLKFAFRHNRRWVRIVLPAGTIGTVGRWGKTFQHLVHVTDPEWGFGYRLYGREEYAQMPYEVEVVGPNVERAWHFKRPPGSTPRRTRRNPSRRRTSRQ